MEPNEFEVSIPADITACPVCKTALATNTSVCSICSFPLNGTEDEKQKFDLDYKVMRAELEGANEVTKKGTKTLFGLSALIFVSDVIYYFINDNTDYLISAFMIPPIYLLLAFWSKKKPYYAILTALVVYFLLMIGNAIFSPISILQGIIVKFIVAYYLITSLKSSKEAEAIQEELARRNWNQPHD